MPAKKTYMDHAATTPLDGEVFAAMKPYFSKKFGNASSLHKFGREANEALEGARKKAADALGAEASEIVFTSGGSESDNLAVKGACFARMGKADSIITSKIEHHAVLAACGYMAKFGFSTKAVGVNREGIVDVGELRKAIGERTALVTIMHANNEIGSIEPIKEIAELAHAKGVLMHTDAVQTAGKIPVDVNGLGVDMLSVSSHKIYGPKGVGCLYVRKGTKLDSLIHGGDHEGRKRAGTENIPGIVGFAKALELAKKRLVEDSARMKRMRDKIIDEALKIDNSWLNGGRENRLPNNVNLGFAFIEGEGLLLKLDRKGIAASTGSACSSHSLEPSHVLLAIGLSPADAHGSLRLTLGRGNTDADVDYLLSALPPIVKELRKISPFTKREEIAAFKGTHVEHDEDGHND